MKNKLLILTIFICFLLPMKVGAARLWSCGFELQSVTSGMEWSITNNFPTISTAIKRSGAASLRINPNDDNKIYHIFAAPAPTADHYFRFYLYIAAAPTGNERTIFHLLDIYNYGSTLSLKLNADRTLELWDEDDLNLVQIGSDSPALSLNTWYRIELSWVYSGAVATAYIDGVSFASGSGIGGLYVQPTHVYLGAHVTDATLDLYFDDVAINDNSGTVQTGLLGAGSIVHLYPNAAGDIDETLETPNGYLNVDEKPTPDDATSYVQFAANNDDFLVNCEASSVAGIGSGDNITLVQVGYRHRTAVVNSAGFTPKIESQAGGTLLSGTAFTHNDTTWKTNGDVYPLNYKLTSYVDPQAGGPWTAALLDTAQIGGTCTDADPDMWLSSLWALVEYGPPPPPPPSPIIIRKPTDAIIFRRNVIFK